MAKVILAVKLVAGSTTSNVGRGRRGKRNRQIHPLSVRLLHPLPCCDVGCGMRHSSLSYSGKG